MEVRAKIRSLRISPKKVRLVIDQIRGKKAEEALQLLQFINKKASRDVSKLLRSAMANAEHNFNLKKDELVIKSITADQGPTLKRWMPRAYGRATMIRKKTTHLSVVLEPASIGDKGKATAAKEKEKEKKEVKEAEKNNKPASVKSKVKSKKEKNN